MREIEKFYYRSASPLLKPIDILSVSTLGTRTTFKLFSHTFYFFFVANMHFRALKQCGLNADESSNLYKTRNFPKKQKNQIRKVVIMVTLGSVATLPWSTTLKAFEVIVLAALPCLFLQFLLFLYFFLEIWLILILLTSNNYCLVKSLKSTSKHIKSNKNIPK